MKRRMDGEGGEEGRNEEEAALLAREPNGWLRQHLELIFQKLEKYVY